jgi:hypothetical protein
MKQNSFIRTLLELNRVATKAATTTMETTILTVVETLDMLDLLSFLSIDTIEVTTDNMT